MVSTIKQEIANLLFPHMNIRYMIKYVRDNHNSNSGLIGAEIGVKGANNSINILKNLDIKCLYLVDSFKKYNGYKYWDKDYESMAKKKLKKYGDEAVLMVDFSQDAVKQFQDGFFDFVYIDANHKYKYVKQDIELWYPKVKNGGILGGHDFRTIAHPGKLRKTQVFNLLSQLKDGGHCDSNLVANSKHATSLRHIQHNDTYRAVMGFIGKESLELNFCGDDWWVIKNLNTGFEEKKGS